MRKTRINYSKEFKIKAVELVEQKGKLSLVARELNIGDESLRKWCKDHGKGALIKDLTSKVKSKEEEIAILKKELCESNSERDVLRRALRELIICLP